MSMRRLLGLVVLLSVFSVVSGALAMEGFIGLTNGYYYNKATGEAWLPHGVAYQTWNRPLGVWQTHEQIKYDLDEMVKMGANSVRIDIVWQHAEEIGDNIYSWDNYDFFIDACEERNLRIFALVGYQWPPNWFPDEWYTQHPPETDASGIVHTNRWQSDIINYSHPDARAQYAEWIDAVCGRYKDEKAIAGWIVGNEYGYLGLWSGLLDGYDPESEQAFRDWLAVKYPTIADANAAWGKDYASFADVDFIEAYTAYGPDGAVWADMVQFREDSIAEFTALSAAAAKGANTNHLISYSTVGMQWGEEDWRYHTEDRAKISDACVAIGAPLDFFSVNNYPWSVLGHESQQGHWGVSYTKKVAKMPVLYSETGFSSSETMWPGMNETRQAPLIRNALWGGLEAGAIGTHVFSWQDRPYITVREKGFGIVYGDRNIKPAYWETRNTYNLMDQVELHEKMMGSEDPVPDIAFLMESAVDSQFNRFECEMQQLAGALERLGYGPYFMDLNDLATGVYTNYKVLILPRNMRVSTTVPGSTKSVLDFIRTEVIPSGVHVLADADIPGLQNELGVARPEYVTEVDALFGVDATDAGGYEARMVTKSYISEYWNLIHVYFNENAVGPVELGYHYWPQVWKYNDEVEVTDGTLWAEMDTRRNKGYEESSTRLSRWNIWTNSGALEIVQYGWEYEGNNMVQMYGDVGMWHDFPANSSGRYTASAYLRSNHDDPLRNGKRAYVAIEWYDKDEELLGVSESTHLTTNTPGDAWVRYQVDATAPVGAHIGRRKIVIEGDGDGSVFVDNKQLAPAVVVKDHGAAKSAIILYSTGDIRPDSDFDGDPDIKTWEWRYDVLHSIIRDYFGVQPSVTVLGENAYLCLADYRTLTDGSTLWQVKNYQYDTNYSNGGPDLTFTITSHLFQAKTVEGWMSGTVIEQNSDGTIDVTLPPDGMEMLHVFDSSLTTQICHLVDAPSSMHPTGDKAFATTVEYDTLGMPEAQLHIAFMEADDNGDGVSNEIYQLVSCTVSNSGVATNWVWIPEPDKGDTDYISTPEGGRYVFKAWLETPGGDLLVESVPQSVKLLWGIIMTNDIPQAVNKGDSLAFDLKWEELNEQIFWQNTPRNREDAFPTRIAVFRSLKTENMYPGHLDRVNRVADWLDSLGYVNGNPLDISFDNFKVSGLLTDDFRDGNLDGWARDAGAGNWDVANGQLRVTRIGNDDNIMSIGDLSWSNYTVETDFMYNEQGPYFNDVELMVRYQNRENFVKVGIQNFYSFWKIKFTIREDRDNAAQGWLYSFPKTNCPTANRWYNFKVQASNDTISVFLDNELMGSFVASNFPYGKVAIGTRAVQLGIWEPPKGYYFIDDDEYSYYAGPDETTTKASPMNLASGYLIGFYSTLVLPGTYTMSDIECENIKEWLPNGLNSLVVIDGGAGKVDEYGAPGSDRLAAWLGVGPTVESVAAITNVTVNDSSHYVMHDYETGDNVALSVTANAYTSLVDGVALGTLQKNGRELPAFIVNTIMTNALAPAKTVCFNFDIDANGGLTNGLALATQRALEWTREQVNKVKLELKYPTPLGDPNLDLTLLEVDGWILGGSGEQTLMVDIPEAGIMTGDNMYWAMYVYPWDATNAWTEHSGFYVTSNDDTNNAGMRTSIAGQGLQLLGGAQSVFAGRAWDMFVAYNTRGESITVRHGLKKKGQVPDEDNFASGNHDAWTATASSDIAWSVAGEALRASVTGGTGSSDITKDSCNVSNRSITLEYDVRFTSGGSSGGVMYRGRFLAINPNDIGWADNSPYYYSGSPFTVDAWHSVILSIRPGTDGMTCDLLVDGDVVFLHEPMDFDDYPESTIGFRSPSGTGTVEWDNFRVVDEEYSYVTEATQLNGEFVPTNAVPGFYFNAPDFDPDMIEYISSTKGGEYEWYIHAPGKGLNSTIDAEIFEGPRMRVEHPVFPTNLIRESTVQIPVTWECLSESEQLPANLHIKLENLWMQETYIHEVFDITTASGNELFEVTIPTDIPASDGFMWVAYIASTTAIDPWEERSGCDETFRFDLLGLPVEKETLVTANSESGDSFVVYADSGIPMGCDIGTWPPSAIPMPTWNGNFPEPTAPEGNEVFYTSANQWVGWGVFVKNNQTMDMSAYADGNIKFWLKSSQTVKAEVKGGGVQPYKNIPSTGGVWQEITIPVSYYTSRGCNISQIQYFLATTITSAGSFMVDHVRWELTSSQNLAPNIYLPGPHIVTVGATTNFQVIAADPEGQTTIFTNTAAPAGATFNLDIFSWSPTVADLGTTNVITFVVDDQQGDENSVVTNSTEIIVPWDGDADGLSDGWEWTTFATLKYFGVDDNDNDGLSNSEEYCAGTSADDADSVFSVTIERNDSQTATSCSIMVDTVPGRVYTIYYSDDELTGEMTWNTFADASNGVGTWTETGSEPSTFTFVDDMGANTTGGQPVNGYRTFKIKVALP